jgi:hypothetical protein
MMKLVWLLLLAVLVAGCAEGTTKTVTVESEPPNTTPVTTPEEEPEEEPAAEPEPERPEPDPDGKFDLTCDYVLGNFEEGPGGYRFIAGGTLENTGNIGIVVRWTTRWSLLGADALRVSELYRLKPGQTKEVKRSVPATQEQIDLHQSADGKCKDNVTVSTTFGEVRE